jgi:hypothetical protein
MPLAVRVLLRDWLQRAVADEVIFAAELSPVAVSQPMPDPAPHAIPSVCQMLLAVHQQFPFQSLSFERELPPIQFFDEHRPVTAWLQRAPIHLAVTPPRSQSSLLGNVPVALRGRGPCVHCVGC